MLAEQEGHPIATTPGCSRVALYRIPDSGPRRTTPLPVPHPSATQTPRRSPRCLHHLLRPDRSNRTPAAESVHKCRHPSPSHRSARHNLRNLQQAFRIVHLRRSAAQRRSSKYAIEHNAPATTGRRCRPGCSGHCAAFGGLGGAGATAQGAAADRQLLGLGGSRLAE